MLGYFCLCYANVKTISGKRWKLIQLLPEGQKLASIYSQTYQWNIILGFDNTYFNQLPPNPKISFVYCIGSSKQLGPIGVSEAKVSQIPSWFLLIQVLPTCSTWFSFNFCLQLIRMVCILIWAPCLKTSAVLQRNESAEPQAFGSFPVPFTESSNGFLPIQSSGPT